MRKSLKLFSFVLLLSLLFQTVSAAGERMGEPDRLELTWEAEIREDVLTFSVSSHGSQGFCGLLLSFSYVPAYLKPISAKSGEGLLPLYFSWGFLSEEVRVLADGSQNTIGEGLLFSIEFAICQDLREEPDFLPVLEFSQSYRAEGNGFRPLSVNLSLSQSQTELRPLTVGIREKDGAVRLALAVLSPGGFAAGIEATVADPGAGRLDRYFFSKVAEPGSQASLGEVLIPAQGIYCVILKRLSYKGAGVTEDHETILCFVNGSLY